MMLILGVCLLYTRHLVYSSGNTGVSVMLYDPRRANVSKIERECGVKFEHVAAPQPADIAKVAGAEAAENITHMSDRLASYSLCYFVN